LKSLIDYLDASSQTDGFDNNEELRRALASIKRSNKTLHALRDWSKASTQNLEPGPLQGATVVVKDNICVKEYATYAGMKNPIPDELLNESSFISKIKQSGGAIVGKANCAELSLGGTGLNSSVGTPRNPHESKEHRVPGGSSSGTAVAVASDMAMIGICTDSGGSARVPAAVCGLAGYRPSENVIEDDGIIKLGNVDRVGIQAASSDDIRKFCYILFDSEDFSPTSARSLRLKYFPTSLLSAMPDDHLSLYKRRLTRLKKQGHELTEVDSKFITDIFAELEAVEVGKLAAPQLAAFLDEHLPGYVENLDPRIQAMVAEGSRMSMTELAPIMNKLMALAAAKTDELFSSTDLLVTPTVPIRTPRVIDVLAKGGYQKYSDTMLDLTLMGTFFLGPALSKPNGLDTHGLPVGIQYVAAPGNDQLIFFTNL